jgi:hypothetical protein
MDFHFWARVGTRASLSESARLAAGLGLKGVLPSAGGAGLTDSPRRNCFRFGSPAPAELAGFDFKTLDADRQSRIRLFSRVSFPPDAFW